MYLTIAGQNSDSYVSSVIVFNGLKNALSPVLHRNIWCVFMLQSFYKFSGIR